MTIKSLNLRDEGDSTVILHSKEGTVREVRILNLISWVVQLNNKHE